MLPGAEEQQGSPEAGLLFELNYDSWSVNANYSKGNGKCLNFKNPDLQLRMFPGIKGEKNGGLCMDCRESCVYQMKDNLNPEAGTVSLWLSPQNWKVSDNHWQIFFMAKQKNFQIRIYKYMSPGLLIFYMRAPGPDGKMKTYMARTMLNDKDWPNNKWHKLDAVWDKYGMKLYVDGTMPKVYNKNSQIRIPYNKFTSPIKYPKAGAEGTITIGMPRGLEKHKSTDRDSKTAYDEIKIYDRALSAAEIRKAYEKYFPAVKSKKPLLTIPLTATGIKLDGVIAPAEWRDAAIVPVAKFAKPLKSDITCKAYCKYDGKFLYIALHANRPWIRKNHKGHDARLWEDDSFELLLYDGVKNNYHFIVNGNGAIYDELNVQKKWNSNAMCAASSDGKSRSVELKIPVKNLGDFIRGSNWTGNFCATYYMDNGKAIYSSWSQFTGRYDNTKSYGDIIAGKNSSAVQLSSLGYLKQGKLKAKLNVTNPKIRLFGSYDNLPETIIPAGTSWDTTFPSGQHKIMIKGKNANGGVIFFYEDSFFVDHPLSTSAVCYYKRKYIELDVDLNNSGSKNINAIRKSGIKAEVDLIDSKNKVLSKLNAVITKTKSKLKLPFPAQFPKGSYKIKVNVNATGEKLEAEESFIVPDMTPYKEKIALDHSVPKPWTPITQSGKHSFKVLNSVFFWADSPFPAQITVLGENILTKPVTLDYNGNRITWSKFSVDKKFEDYIKFSGLGQAAKVKFAWHGELWFDGTYKVNFIMSPENNPVEIKKLNLSWQMPEKYAKFVLTPTLSRWINNRVELKPAPDMYATAREHVVWLTGHTRGLSWWPESKANWYNSKDEKPIVIKRNGDVTVDMNIISKTVLLKKSAGYSMAFTATPVKPRPEKWRSFNEGNPNIANGSNATITGWGVFRDKSPGNDEMTNPSSHIPRDPASFIKLGPNVFPYNIKCQIGTNEPEYEYFWRSWAKIPGHKHHLSKYGVKYELQPCCGNTKITDLMAWRINDLFKKYKIGGLYYDVGGAGFCENSEHGHGGLDAFGQFYMSSSAWGLRQLLIRVYKLHKKYGKSFFYHNHSYFNPVCHTFTDYFYPGEQYCRDMINYKHFYCEGISPEEYQSELNSVIKGVGLVFLPQYGRAAKIIPTLKYMQNEFKNNPEWTLRLLTPIILHDLNISASWCDRKTTIPKWWKIKDRIHLEDAKFCGYWNAPGISSGSPQLYVSVYTWKKPEPYKYLLVAGNLGRNEQKLSLNIDSSRLGFNSHSRFIDLWNNREIKKSELFNRKIKGNHFMLIGVK